MVTRFKFRSFSASLIAATAASVLAACASTSVRAAGTLAAPAPLTRLPSAPALRDRGPLTTKAAEAAVRVAERPGADSHQKAYRVAMADQVVDIIGAPAEILPAEELRPGLPTESKKAGLDARTREPGLVRTRAVLARLEGAEKALAAIVARGEAPAPERAAAISDRQASDARRDAECAELAASISRQPIARQPPGSALLQASVTGAHVVVTLAGFVVLR